MLGDFLADNFVEGLDTHDPGGADSTAPYTGDEADFRFQKSWTHGRFPVGKTREPGGTQVGEKIRELLLHDEKAEIGPTTELLLILAARSAFVENKVKPALAAGWWVISDRFELSSFAYQGSGRGLDMDQIRKLNSFATGGLKPDLCLVLDISVEEGRKRQARAGDAQDRIEKEGDDFLHNVRKGYLDIAAKMENTVLIPADGPVADVKLKIQEELRRFPEIRPLRSRTQ